MTIRYGCQTYTWQMSYEKYKNSFADILDTIKNSGFSGVEAEVCMLGSFYNDSNLLQEALAMRGLELAALTLALPWLGAVETKQERDEADRLFKYLKQFPKTKLILVQLPGDDRSNLEERQRNGLSCVNAVAQRAYDSGIISAFHPNSPNGSVFRTAKDYEVMFSGLDYRYVGYCPDSGHIARGGMDVMEVFRNNGPQILHVHFKDISMNHQWRTMGQGVIDHKEIVNLLQNTGYTGWVMVEEESNEAEANPVQATTDNGLYVNTVLQ